MHQINKPTCSSTSREGITCAVQGRCKVLERKTQMTFQQLEVELPQGISAVDSVVTLKKGINNYFQAAIANQSKNDIVFRKNTNVGAIEYVKSVIPLQLKQSALGKYLSVNKTTVIPPD